jgi:hypothetical protein
MPVTEGNSCAERGYLHLYGPHNMEACMEHVYSNPAYYDWLYIRKCWEYNWYETNPYAPIKMQKTPADIFRVKMMQDAFEDLNWIISVKNPYSYVESMIRRKMPYISDEGLFTELLFHVLRVMEIQIYNKALIGERGYTVRYEDFVKDPKGHCDNIVKWMPELMSLNPYDDLIVKHRHVHVEDTGLEKVYEMFDKHPGIKEEINKYFIPMEPLLNHWGYEILQ